MTSGSYSPFQFERFDVISVLKNSKKYFFVFFKAKRYDDWPPFSREYESADCNV